VEALLAESVRKFSAAAYFFGRSFNSNWACPSV